MLPDLTTAASENRNLVLEPLRVAGLPSARLQRALLLVPALLARELSSLPVVSPAPPRQ
jgi:hypothetical protein